MGMTNRPLEIVCEKVISTGLNQDLLFHIPDDGFVHEFIF